MMRATPLSFVIKEKKKKERKKGKGFNVESWTGFEG